MTVNFERYRLSGGYCYCRPSGPVQGPILLTIHGIPVRGWELELLAPVILEFLHSSRSDEVC